MLPRNRLLLPTISGLLALALVAVILLGDSKSGDSSRADGFDGATIPGGMRAPNFRLNDRDGRAVSLGSLRGRVTMLVFLPVGGASHLGADCRACRLVAQQVRGALDELGRGADVQTIFVSGEVPWKSANRLLAGASLSNRAEYLTGGAIEVGRVWRAYRIALPSSHGSAAEASVSVVLVDKQGLERVAFGIEQLTPEALSHDIRLLEGA